MSRLRLRVTTYLNLLVAVLIDSSVVILGIAAHCYHQNTFY